MDMMLIIDVVIMIFGIYMAIISVQMIRTGRIHKIILAEEELKKCKKPKEFVRYLSPRMLVFSVIVIVVGIAGILFDTVAEAGKWNYIFLLVFLLAFFVFSTQFRKAREDFVS